MSLGHEKLDVYQLAIRYVAWVFSVATDINGLHRHAREGGRGFTVEDRGPAVYPQDSGDSVQSVEELPLAGFRSVFDIDIDIDIDGPGGPHQNPLSNCASCFSSGHEHFLMTQTWGDRA